MYVLKGLYVSSGRAFLGAGLYNSLILSGGLDHLSAFPDIMRDRFLDINILARLTGPDSYKRMPVIGRRGTDSVDLLIFQEFADIRVALDVYALFLEVVHPLVGMVLIRITYRHETHAF